jgi:hypothetical protein
MPENNERCKKTSICRMLGWTSVTLVLIANVVFLVMGYMDRYELNNSSQITEKSHPTSQQTNTLSQSQLLTAVGQSQRIGDILAYWWNAEQRDTISGKDYELVELAKAEILSDDTSIQFNRTMNNGGITKSFIRNENYQYTIFNRLTMPFKEGSYFEDGIENASIFLPGELVREPSCTKGLVPIVFQSEAYPIGEKPAGLTLTLEQPFGYRVTVPKLDFQAMKHRLIVKSECRKKQIADELK